MALTIVSVAYPLAPVGVDAVGGAEQVLALIDRALVQAGHRSIVIGCEGSVVAGELAVVPRRNGPLTQFTQLTDEVRQEAQSATRRVLEELLDRERPDVVHFHGIDFASYLPERCPPSIATLHLPPSWYPPEVFALPSRGVLLQCVSESQRRACPAGAEIGAVIPNGVPLEDLAPSGRRTRRTLVALGRICPEKGFHHALEAARRADAPLLIAGQVFGYEAHERYFREEVVPRLDRWRRFIGPVSMERKRRLLAGARALLVPSLAPETSSLVAMEALACGTPVIAFRVGALPEIVEHGRTGFLVEDAREMAEAIGRLEELDPAECRRAAEQRFSASTMTGRYVALYEKWGQATFPKSPSPNESAASTPRLSTQTREMTRQVRESVGEKVACPQFRVVRSPGLEDLRPAWLELWREDRRATAFTHPDWVIPWCRHFGRDRVEAFSVWRGDSLVGLAPMEVWPEGTRRVLKLLGSGVSDQLDVLTSPEHDEEVRELLVSAFGMTSGAWNDCLLEPLGDDSPWAGDGSAQRLDVSPVLQLPRSVEDLPSAIPARLLANVRAARRRLERTAPLRFGTATASEVDGWMSALFELHRARWRQRGEGGVLEEPRVLAFHRDVSRRLQAAGVLRLHALFHGDRLFAVLYAFAAHGRVHYYLSGLDPAYEKASPGSLIVAASIEEAVKQGAREFDFLRGAEPYKYAWGAKDRPLWRRRVEVDA